MSIWTSLTCHGGLVLDCSFLATSSLSIKLICYLFTYVLIFFQWSYSFILSERILKFKIIILKSQNVIKIINFRKPTGFVSREKMEWFLSREGQGTFVFLCQSWISCLSDQKEEKRLITSKWTLPVSITHSNKWRRIT